MNFLFGSYHGQFSEILIMKCFIIFLYKKMVLLFILNKRIVISLQAYMWT